jgi:hypothetical protein
VPDNPLIFILQCSLQPARVIINFEREQNRHSWAIVTELKKACEIKRELRATKESTLYKRVAVRMDFNGGGGYD